MFSRCLICVDLGNKSKYKVKTSDSRRTLRPALLSADRWPSHQWRPLYAMCLLSKQEVTISRQYRWVLKEKLRLCPFLSLFLILCIQGGIMRLRALAALKTWLISQHLHDDAQPSLTPSSDLLRHQAGKRLTYKIFKNTCKVMCVCIHKHLSEDILTSQKKSTRSHGAFPQGYWKLNVDPMGKQQGPLTT